MSTTSYNKIYDLFLSKITDDMYMELTEEETRGLKKELLLSALPYFEFPRFNIFERSDKLEEFNIELTHEEQNIIAVYMMVEWLNQQLASVENTRMKYSGSDFKFTSQANHMAKLKDLVKLYTEKGFHLQRLYKRRKVDSKTGQIRSTFGQIMKPLEEADFNDN